jgi:hypothetical protein
VRSFIEALYFRRSFPFSVAQGKQYEAAAPEFHSFLRKNTCLQYAKQFPQIFPACLASPLRRSAPCA